MFKRNRPETFDGLRLVALELAIEAASGPDPKKIVESASQFLDFLTGEEPERPSTVTTINNGQRIKLSQGWRTV